MSARKRRTRKLRRRQRARQRTGKPAVTHKSKTGRTGSIQKKRQQSKAKEQP